jgi:ABC-2 type transport system ATP-binding protein
MESILSLSDVTYRYKVRDTSTWKPWVKRDGAGIHSIDLEINKGVILGLIGPNGAGKTTLLRVISGIFTHDGNIDKGIETRRSNIGHMPEQVRWEGRSTVAETLTAMSLMHGSEVDVDKLLKRVGLSSRSDLILDNLSQGMRQRLSLACALLGNPRILVMDEPLNGLDPLAQRAFCNLLKQLAAKGVAIIISSHQVAEMADLVDRIALLHHGQLLIEGTINSVKDALGLNADDVDLVDMICAATGIAPEDVSMDLS